MADRPASPKRDPAILKSGVRRRPGLSVEGTRSEVTRSDARIAPEVSGLALRTLLRTLRHLRGKACLSSILSQLPSNIAEELASSSLRASGWYPLAWLIDMHHVAQRVTHAGPELSRELGYEGSRYIFRGANSFYVVSRDPAALLSQAPWAYSLVYKGCGELEVLESAPGFARARWTDAVALTESLWREQLGSCEAALELSGAEGLRVELVAGGQSGSPVTEVIVNWLV